MWLEENYEKKGHSYKEYINFIKYETENTEIVKVEKSSCNIWYSHGKGANGKAQFTKLTNKILEVLGEQSKDTVKDLPDTIEKKLLDESLKKCAITISYVDSKTGRVEFCALSEKGEYGLCQALRVRKFPVDRSKYLFALNSMASLDNGKNFFTFIIKKEGEFKKIFWVSVSDKNTYWSLDYHRIYVGNIMSSKIFGKPQFCEWRYTHRLLSARIEFPESKITVMSDCNSEISFIPGIEVLDSDIGEHGFEVIITLRKEDDLLPLNLASLIMSHKGEIDMERFVEFYQKDMPDIVRKWQEDVPFLLDVDVAVEESCRKIVSDNFSQMGKKFEKNFKESFFSQNIENHSRVKLIDIICFACDSMSELVPTGRKTLFDIRKAVSKGLHGLVLSEFEGGV